MFVCAVPGCTSKLRIKKEKIHRFCFPKDPHLRALWEKAVKCGLRKKSQDRVCQYHFNKEDILWTKEFLAPNGTVIGVGKYQVPRLRNGVVPSKFPWSVRKGQTTNSVVELPSITKQSHDLEEMGSITESNNLFSDIKAKDFNLPPPWVRVVMMNSDKELIAFILNTSRKEGNKIKIVTLKEIIITEDLCVQINIGGRDINHELYGIRSPIIDLQELQDAIFILHNLGVCSGISVVSNNLGCNVSYIDECEVLRHEKCTLLSDDSICEYCKQLENHLENRKKNINTKTYSRQCKDDQSMLKKLKIQKPR